LGRLLTPLNALYLRSLFAFIVVVQVVRHRVAAPDFDDHRIDSYHQSE
jgi:hypothetical protein